MRVDEACRKGRQLLEEAGIYNANELNSLFRKAASCNRMDIYYEELEESKCELFFSLIERRIAGEPLQYLCGEWPFLDFTVRVDGRALIPRPETEQLAQLSFRCTDTPSKILDLCSGSGVLAIAMAKHFPAARVTAVELSSEACSLIKENASLNGVEPEIINADAIAFAQESSDQYDLIVCNPPYITPEDYSSNLNELRFEPKMAFVGGEDGLYFYRLLIPLCIKLLKPEGYLTFEIGNDQGESVTAMLKDAGYRDIKLYQDCFGLDRNTTAKCPCK